MIWRAFSQRLMRCLRRIVIEGSIYSGGARSVSCSSSVY